MNVRPVLLVDIEAINERKLNQEKLEQIDRSFQDIIYKSEYPICIDRRFGRPFKIIDGRHRIYIARQKSLRLVPAIVID